MRHSGPFFRWKSALLAVMLGSLPVLLAPMTAAGQGAATSSGGQIGRGGDATWSAEAAPQTVRPGERFAARLRANVEEGWYMYALDSPAGQPLSVSLDSLPAGIDTTGTLRQSTPTRKYDPNFEADAFFYEESAEVRAGLHVGEEVKPGTYVVGGSVRYMVCSDQMCMPPTTKPVSMTIEVESGAPRDAYAAVNYGDLVEPGPAASDNSQGATSGAGGMAPGEAAGGRGSLWGFLLLAVGAGVGAFFMPCIFPMVPLTVSYFAKGSGRGQSMRQAGVYGLTIVGAFTGLGALAAALLGAAGAQSIAASPWTNLAIGGVLVAFGLSLLGLFELRLPTGLTNYLNRQSERQSGYAGAVFMGLTLTVVSFSCTAPFVGGLLAAAAQGTWLYPVLGMAVFSGVLALPFVGFALFPEALKRLPSSGGWMNALKVTLGFVELAAALKFFSNADLVWGGAVWLSRPLVIAFTIVLFALAGAYLLGALRLSHDPPAETPRRVGMGRVLAAALFLGLALYMTPGLLGARLGSLDAYFPPRHATDVGRLPASSGPETTSVSALDWNQNDIDAAMAEAKESGTPVFVDFSGYTCTNCREMEANVFPAPAVAEHLRADFVLLRLYTDDADKGPALQRYQQQTVGTVALPSYAVVTPEGNLAARHSGMASPKAFDAFLEEGLSQSPEDAAPQNVSRGTPSALLARGRSKRLF
ncbi:protein-disulfide reductase DsbD family protein [Salinibacter ruber]|uniref:protein-disulfide reductase DsbD family protein n=1 Tax=Salinibacter ruber TaxID=146919 RepID=UPI0021694A72|nr:protein-disulfide reductase DsbD [Salinibacter ruber]MCS4057773.1 thiol:disulfide interchange protein DsbD [Salinibacter ruber]